MSISKKIIRTFFVGLNNLKANNCKQINFKLGKNKIVTFKKIN